MSGVWVHVVNVVLCLLAFSYHFAEKWVEYRQTTARIGLVAWVHEVPAVTVMSVLATLTAFFGAYAVEWMNPGMAVATGYAGDSITRRIVGKFSE